MDKDGLIVLIGALILWAFAFAPEIITISESLKSYYKNLRNGNRNKF
jgi:hypothetical protein